MFISGFFFDLMGEVFDVYEVLFFDGFYLLGVRWFLSLVFIMFDDLEVINNWMVWSFFGIWEKFLLIVFSDGDLVMVGGERFF